MFTKAQIIRQKVGDLDMSIISRFMNSFIFWAAWIIIPVLMEIVPSVGSVIVLLKRDLYLLSMKTDNISGNITSYTGI